MDVYNNEQIVAFASLEDEYTPRYCLQLEAAYGHGMMSEGGLDGIELMFDSIPLENKCALDIGSGLGGLAIYLAENYDMKVTGLEVNPWMVTESEKRIPEHLTDRLNFLLSNSNSHWPLDDKSFDLIFSKGVLTHVEKKDELFQECYRLLDNDGLLVITDWLSSEDRKWGENIARLIDLENLALYPESESGYIKSLTNNGFSLNSVRDDSAEYLRYNHEIIARLQRLKNIQSYSDLFTEAELEASIDGYTSIAKALETGELRVIRFVAQKIMDSMDRMDRMD
jgi:phosphoethanolamine N-methyltransferase